MKIEAVDLFTVRRARKRRFVIATGSSEDVVNAIVRLESGNMVGWGAAAANTVTGEDAETFSAALPIMAEAIRGREFSKAFEFHSALDRVLRGHSAAKAAFDIAFHDLLAKAANQSLHRFLGGTRDRLVDDITLGINDIAATLDLARASVSQGFRALKVKVGLDMDRDAKCLRTLRENLGEKVELRVDANQGYTLDQAKRFVELLEEINAEFLEQPLPAADLESMRILTEFSPVPIMADESVKGSEDAKTLAWSKYADLVNVKLMKAGGITAATDVAAIAESAGIGAMVGCMGELQLSIAAGLHFALSQRNVQYIDLDSHLSVEGDPTSGLRFEDGELVAPASPGLGIEVDESLLFRL